MVRYSVLAEHFRSFSVSREDEAACTCGRRHLGILRSSGRAATYTRLAAAARAHRHECARDADALCENNIVSSWGAGHAPVKI